jgi:hypothetical protein
VRGHLDDVLEFIARTAMERRLIPLHHPSDGPPPHSLREQGGDA